MFKLSGYTQCDYCITLFKKTTLSATALILVLTNKPNPSFFFFFFFFLPEVVLCHHFTSCHVFIFRCGSCLRCFDGQYEPALAYQFAWGGLLGVSLFNASMIARILLGENAHLEPQRWKSSSINSYILGTTKANDRMSLACCAEMVFSLALW
jgi:hypothetical protein